MSGSIFFTIFQTFMSGADETPYFGDYPKDFFDLIIIDECHRGGANDESNWRGILEYFAPAVQLGLTASRSRGSTGQRLPTAGGRCSAQLCRASWSEPSGTRESPWRPGGR